MVYVYINSKEFDAINDLEIQMLGCLESAENEEYIDSCKKTLKHINKLKCKYFKALVNKKIKGR